MRWTLLFISQTVQLVCYCVRSENTHVCIAWGSETSSNNKQQTVHVNCNRLCSESSEQHYCAGFLVLTVVLLCSPFFWDVTLQHWANNPWQLKKLHCLLCQGQAVQEDTTEWLTLKMKTLRITRQVTWRHISVLCTKYQIEAAIHTNISQYNIHHGRVGTLKSELTSPLSDHHTYCVPPLYTQKH